MAMGEKNCGKDCSEQNIAFSIYNFPNLKHFIKGYIFNISLSNRDWHQKKE